MYIPANFRMTERETLEFIQEFPFGMLISNDESGLQTTHIPFYLIEQSDKLYLHTHLSAVNTQGNALDQKEILVVFHGPNAYISSSWYNHPNVSTWNYLAVHVKGKSRIMETQELIASLSRLTELHEQGEQRPFLVKDMDEKFFNSHLNGVTGIEIEITVIEGVKKLSQNRDEENLNRIIDALKSRNNHFDADIAKRMEIEMDINKP